MPRDEDDDDTFDRVSDIADRLKLKGKDRDRYIHNHMSDMGYERQTSRESYKKKEDRDDDEGGREDRYRPRGRSGGSSGRRSDDWD